ncbi:MAG: carbonic anhydrase [Microbacteriaceae bacterium]|nr:MAG: carbonic anhydrase [Microbacteriaceae bacterium]
MPRPEQAWNTLERGNERFVGDVLEHPHQDANRRRETASSQHPIAAVFCCSDSRVSPETIFDLGLGDAFVIRNAGQVASSSALGTLEYAVGLLSVPVLVVLGHESCGGVRAAIDSQAADADPLPPHIADLIAPIVPVVHAVTKTAAGAVIDPTAVDAAEVGREHVRATIAEILEQSPIISQAVADGDLAIVGANYELSTGRVVPDAKVGLA